MTVGRSVATTSQRLTTTGTPPSTRRLSSSIGKNAYSELTDLTNLSTESDQVQVLVS